MRKLLTFKNIFVILILSKSIELLANPLIDLEKGQIDNLQFLTGREVIAKNDLSKNIFFNKTGYIVSDDEANYNKALWCSMDHDAYVREKEAKFEIFKGKSWNQQQWDDFNASPEGQKFWSDVRTLDASILNYLAFKKNSSYVIESVVGKYDFSPQKIIHDPNTYVSKFQLWRESRGPKKHHVYVEINLKNKMNSEAIQISCKIDMKDDEKDAKEKTIKAVANYLNFHFEL